jgi:hypothetical protein
MLKGARDFPPPFFAMPWQPSSEESIELLRRLRHRVAERGDQRLALLLAGVELYAVLGREFELLEIMRTFAHEMHEAVEGTPSIKELEDLFNRDPPP